MLKGAFRFCLGSDHFQPVMVLSLEHAPRTSPYQRFLNVHSFYIEETDCQLISIISRIFLHGQLFSLYRLNK